MQIGKYITHMLNFLFKQKVLFSNIDMYSYLYYAKFVAYIVDLFPRFSNQNLEKV